MEKRQKGGPIKELPLKWLWVDQAVAVKNGCGGQNRVTRQPKNGLGTLVGNTD